MQLQPVDRVKMWVCQYWQNSTYIGKDCGRKTCGNSVRESNAWLFSRFKFVFNFRIWPVSISIKRTCSFWTVISWSPTEMLVLSHQFLDNGSSYFSHSIIIHGHEQVGCIHIRQDFLKRKKVNEVNCACVAFDVHTVACCTCNRSTVWDRFRSYCSRCLWRMRFSSSISSLNESSCSRSRDSRPQIITYWMHQFNLVELLR